MIVNVNEKVQILLKYGKGYITVAGVTTIAKSEYMPSIPQLEKLAEVLGFNITDLYVENEPKIYTAYRSSSMSEEEKAGVDHMFEMMMVSKQQLLMRKAMLNE